MMKKVLSILMTVILVFAVAGCGDKTEEQNGKATLQHKTYEMQDDVQGNQSIVLGYDGDQVKEIEMQITIPYTGSSKEEMEKVLNQSIEKFTKVEGTEAEAKYGTDEAKLFVTMDLDKMGLDKLNGFGLNVADDESLKTKVLSLKVVEKQLKEMGFTVKK